MGVKERNFPKQVGSGIIAGAGGVIGMNAASFALQAVQSVVMLEGGAEE